MMYNRVSLSAFGGKKAAVALAVMALVGVVGFLYVAQAQSTAPLTIRWLITHRPVELFHEPAQVFASEFQKRTDRSVAIEVLGPDDYEVGSQRILGPEALEMLHGGDVQFVTINIKRVTAAVPEVSVLMLPFLFATYADAERAYDGPIGKRILDMISEGTGAKALAFTYSGGFMVIQSNTQNFQSAADFRGKRIATSNGDTSVESLRALGADAVALASGNGLNQMIDDYDGIETAYTRLGGATPKFITETKHSLLITAILVSRDFYDSLTAEEQRALEETASIAAKAERAASIALAVKNKQALLSKGTVIAPLSPEARNEFVRLSESVYARHASALEAELVGLIRQGQ